MSKPVIFHLLCSVISSLEPSCSSGDELCLLQFNAIVARQKTDSDVTKHIKKYDKHHKLSFTPFNAHNSTEAMATGHVLSYHWWRSHLIELVLGIIAFVLLIMLLYKMRSSISSEQEEAYQPEESYYTEEEEVGPEAADAGAFPYG